MAAGVAVGAWVVHRRGASVLLFMDAAAPALLVAQGIGRLGNYFNQELFGGPTDLPWALEVDGRYRPANDPLDATYHPTFLYEMLWNFAGAALLVWIGRRYRIRPPGLFCLYVAIYSLGRIFWEQLRVDPSRMFLGPAAQLLRRPGAADRRRDRVRLEPAAGADRRRGHRRRAAAIARRTREAGPLEGVSASP